MSGKEKALIQKYAYSFVDQIADREDIWAIYDDIHRLAAVIRETRVNRILNDATVPTEAKKEFIQPLRQSQYRVVNDLVEQLSREGHSDLLLATLEDVLYKISKQKNEFDAVIASVQPLTEEQKKRICALVEKRFDIKVRAVREEIERELLGGFVVTVNHQVMDASVRTQLKDIRSRL